MCSHVYAHYFTSDFDVIQKQTQIDYIKTSVIKNVWTYVRPAFNLFQCRTLTKLQLVRRVNAMTKPWSSYSREEEDEKRSRLPWWDWRACWRWWWATSSPPPPPPPPSQTRISTIEEFSQRNNILNLYRKETWHVYVLRPIETFVLNVLVYYFKLVMHFYKRESN